MNVDYELLNSNYRQDLISGREEEFKNIYQDKNLYKNNNNKSARTKKKEKKGQFVA